MGRNMSAEQQNNLKNSECGRHGEKVFVCCPNTFTIDDLPTGQCGLQATDNVFGSAVATLTDFPWYGNDLLINESLNLFVQIEIDGYLFS